MFTRVGLRGYLVFQRVDLHKGFRMVLWERGGVYGRIENKRRHLRWALDKELFRWVGLGRVVG